jgi:NAD(P)-dependent dehydrogenase (short-subunit alcohol dehydrogenase family)
MEPTSTKKTALITGGASGLGKAIAQALEKRGFSVLGTTRKPEAAAGAGVPMIALDVRSDESVRAALAEVRARAGRLDVLINNAGYRLLGAAEETSIEEAKDVFETNFFGTMRVILAALPMLRDSKGHVVNISSLAGLNAPPFGGVYSASKFAVEAYSEALRHEVKPLGIHVSLIEPGVIRSEWRQAPHLPKNSIADYRAARDRALMATARFDKTGIDAAKVAEAVARVATSSSPALRHRVGKDAEWLPRLRSALPWSIYEAATRKRYGLDGDG